MMDFHGKSSPMRNHLVLRISLLALLTGSLASAQHAIVEGSASIEKAGKLFRTSCSNCHVAPDTDFATDRAWLAQVFDTA